MSTGEMENKRWLRSMNNKELRDIEGHTPAARKEQERREKRKKKI